MKIKKVWTVISLAMLVNVWMPQCWSATASLARVYSWQDKLQRGAVNIVTSPAEVALRIHNTTEEKNLLVGWTVGLVAGLGNGLLRFGAGVVDLVTFPFDFPEGNKAPLIDPEYVWEKPGPKLI